MGQVWFGTKGYMRWVKDPAVGMGASPVGWSTNSQLLNGKKYVRRSNNSHREYEMTWNLTRRENLEPILSFLSGTFGDKIYFVDPFAMNRNMFPLDWSVPMLGAQDGTVLNGAEKRPSLVPTATNGYLYPYQSAVYTVTSGAWVPEVWLPIPTGYTLHLGFHGLAGTGGTVTYSPTVGGLPGSFTALTPISPSSSVRTNVMVDGGSDGVVVKLGGNGTLTMSGLTAVLLPTGSAVTPSGAFIQGSGTRGTVPMDQPVLQAYSAAQDLVGLSVTLVETD